MKLYSPANRSDDRHNHIQTNAPFNNCFDMMKSIHVYFLNTLKSFAAPRTVVNIFLG